MNPILRLVFELSSERISERKAATARCNPGFQAASSRDSGTYFGVFRSGRFLCGKRI
jgi:hypothetical protein